MQFSPASPAIILTASRDGTARLCDCRSSRGPTAQAIMAGPPLTALACKDTLVSLALGTAGEPASTVLPAGADRPVRELEWTRMGLLRLPPCAAVAAAAGGGKTVALRARVGQRWQTFCCLTAQLSAALQGLVSLASGAAEDAAWG